MRTPCHTLQKVLVTLHITPKHKRKPCISLPRKKQAMYGESKNEVRIAKPKSTHGPAAAHAQPRYSRRLPGRQEAKRKSVARLGIGGRAFKPNLHASSLIWDTVEFAYSTAACKTALWDV